MSKGISQYEKASAELRRMALIIILIEGITFIVLSIFNVREKIVEAIPLGIRLGISPAIGMMLMNIGLGSNIGIYSENGGPFYVMRDFFGALTPSVLKTGMGDIGYAIERHCESQSYGIVREFVGHGIGKTMHEDPAVPNYGRRGSGAMLKKGMCIAIEPMITMGDRRVWLESDGWSVRTRDGKYAAHYEHTVAIDKGEADILSSFRYIEEVLGENAI